MIGLNEVVLSHVFGRNDENIAADDEDVDLFPADDEDGDLLNYYSVVTFAVYCMPLSLDLLEHSLLAWMLVESDSFQALFSFMLSP